MGVQDEVGKWGLELDATLRKYQQETKSMLINMAARSRLGVPGPAQEVIQNLGGEAKRELTKANAEIYEKELKQLDQVDQTAEKVTIGLAKLDLEQYKANLDNALALEGAREEYNITARKAQLAIMRSEIERRMVAIIEEQARIEAEINYYKTLQVQAEAISLEAEIALIYEKVKTAEAQLPIIAELYKLIAAEYLLVDAEERRAEILPLVLAAEQALAEVRQEMIPMQVEKANARILQADAITQEVEVKKLIAELGYRRLELKDAEEAADHEARLAELARDEAHLEYIRANAATDLAKQQARTILDQYETAIQQALVELRKALEMDEKGYRIGLKWFWTNFELLHDIMIKELERGLYAKDLSVKMANIQTAASDECKRVRASAQQRTESFSAEQQWRYITKG